MFTNFPKSKNKEKNFLNKFLPIIDKTFKRLIKVQEYRWILREQIGVIFTEVSLIISIINKSILNHPTTHPKKMSKENDWPRIYVNKDIHIIKALRG